MQSAAVAVCHTTAATTTLPASVRGQVKEAHHLLADGQHYVQALHKETILVVAAQSPPASGRSSPPGGGPAALPLVATTTIFLVRALPLRCLPSRP